MTALRLATILQKVTEGQRFDAENFEIPNYCANPKAPDAEGSASAQLSLEANSGAASQARLEI